MIVRITHASVVGAYRLELRFNDGVTKTVDLESLLVGPIFEPLRDADYFALVKLNRECGTVTWPNGADFAPEALYELDAVEQDQVI